jgi:hypothetical protein
MIISLPRALSFHLNVSNTLELARSSSRFGRLSPPFSSFSAALDPPLDALHHATTQPPNRMQPTHPILCSIALHHVHHEPMPGYKRAPEPSAHSFPLTATPLLSIPTYWPSEKPQLFPSSLLAGGSRTAAATAWLTCTVTDAPDTLLPPSPPYPVHHHLTVLTHVSSPPKSVGERRHHHSAGNADGEGADGRRCCLHHGGSGHAGTRTWALLNVRPLA